MKKLSLFIVIMFASLCFAVPSKSKKFKFPAHARKVNSYLYDLGTKKDIDGATLQGYAFVHPKKLPHHRENHPNKPDNSDPEPVCYTFLAPLKNSGVRWKMTESYIVDPTSSNSSLDEVTVITTVSDSLNVWNSQVSSPIFGLQTSGIVDFSSIATSLRINRNK